uniref:Secreted protein n=1 Tax=Panagrellus redivivus TaxID=6233 RepID=A0A7E4UNE1_PANRE
MMLLQFCCSTLFFIEVDIYRSATVAVGDSRTPSFRFDPESRPVATEIEVEQHRPRKNAQVDFSGVNDPRLIASLHIDLLAPLLFALRA